MYRLRKWSVPAKVTQSEGHSSVAMLGVSTVLPALPASPLSGFRPDLSESFCQHSPIKGAVTTKRCRSEGVWHSHIVPLEMHHTQ